MSGGALWLAENEKDQRRQNAAIRQLMEGRSNATGTVTFSSTGATSTTVTAPTVGASSVVVLMPQTTAATSGLTNAYIPSTDVTPGQFVVHHSSSTSTSRVFGWIALG